MCIGLPFRPSIVTGEPSKSEKDSNQAPCHAALIHGTDGEMVTGTLRIGVEAAAGGGEMR